MYVVNVCLRLVPRCVSTGPVVVHLAENVNVNTKDSPTEYMTPSPGEADAARPPRASVRAAEVVRDSFNRETLRNFRLR